MKHKNKIFEALYNEDFDDFEEERAYRSSSYRKPYDEVNRDKKKSNKPQRDNKKERWQ